MAGDVAEFDCDERRRLVKSFKLKRGKVMIGEEVLFKESGIVQRIYKCVDELPHTLLHNTL